MSWNYAELSTMAKANGGPEALVEALVQSGVSQGKESMYPVVAGALVIGAAIWEGGKYLRKKLSMKETKNLSEDDIQMIKKEVIEGIQKYDADKEGDDSLYKEN